MPNTTTNENVNPYEKFFDIVTSGEKMGQVSLKNAYRGDGDPRYPASIRDTEGDVQQQPLPEMLVIPDSIGETPVTSLAPGMFAGNNGVKRITLPTTVNTIPEFFCRLATNLRSIHGTENIETIEKAAFRSTRIKNALFPKLTSLCDGAFIGCAYLTVVDIGQVNAIPQQAFANCALLCEVIARNKVISIGTLAFYQTRSLRELPLLADVTTVEENAFFNSRICTTLPNVPRLPDASHEVNFWSGVPFTPCRNRIVSKLSHEDTRWSNQMSMAPYTNHRALFAVMHIHSAITGKYYSEPVGFFNELDLYGIPQQSSNNWAKSIDDVKDLFKALGYQTEVRGKDETLNSRDYNALVDALAHGAYVYTQIQSPNDYEVHGVALYGINDLGEVCVLDSGILHKDFLAGGLEPGIDIYTYTMPYQNLVYPDSDFIIIYPPCKEPTVEWTGSVAPNMFTSDSLPGEYPKNQVTICRVSNDEQLPGSQNGILTAYRVGDIAYRTYLPDTEATLHMQVQSGAGDAWSNWVDCNRKDFTRTDNNSINRLTPPSDLPIGVTVCAISLVDPDLPEGVMGYLTAYRLPVDDNTSNPPEEIIREEWQPINSNKKYVRYPGSTTPWGDWSVFEPKACNPQVDDTSGESQ